MTDVITSLRELGIKEWVLRGEGEPTTEAEFNAMFRKVIGKTSNDTAIESDKTSDFGVTWKQVSDKMKVLKDAEPMRLLRLERDRLLAETDWWASSDLSSSFTDAQKKYRQDLRDITKSATSLDDVTWPSKP
jgi:hypothetical protein